MHRFCFVVSCYLLFVCRIGNNNIQSFPMHHSSVTKNYAWLPHNVNKSVETPPEYQDMPVQPLGDRQSFYEEMIQGCVEYYGDKGQRCIINEEGRVQMSLRQPKASLFNQSHGLFCGFLCFAGLVSSGRISHRINLLSHRVCTTTPSLGTPR